MSTQALRVSDKVMFEVWEARSVCFQLARNHAEDPTNMAELVHASASAEDISREIAVGWDASRNVTARSPRLRSSGFPQSR